jgi:hypothetical protein
LKIIEFSGKIRKVLGVSLNDGFSEILKTEKYQAPP